MSNSKISIIIPVYNTENYLERCLNSAINQTHKDIEIICIDDKSTDNSANILKKFINIKNIKIILLNENKGVSNARNIALENITGNYIMFLDSDDFLELDACKLLYDRLCFTNSDLACGGHSRINTLDHKLKPWLPNKNISSTPNKDIYCFTKYRNVTQKLFKTSIIKENNITFLHDLNYMEDALFLVKYLSYCKKIVGLRKSIYNVQINPNSLCRNKDLADRRLKDSIKAQEYINELTIDYKKNK